MTFVRHTILVMVKDHCVHSRLLAHVLFPPLPIRRRCLVFVRNQFLGISSYLPSMKCTPLGFCQIVISRSARYQHRCWRAYFTFLFYVFIPCFLPISVCLVIVWTMIFRDIFLFLFFFLPKACWRSFL